MFGKKPKQFSLSLSLSVFLSFSLSVYLSFFLAHSSLLGINIYFLALSICPSFFLSHILLFTFHPLFFLWLNILLSLSAFLIHSLSLCAFISLSRSLSLSAFISLSRSHSRARTHIHKHIQALTHNLWQECILPLFLFHFVCLYHCLSLSVSLSFPISSAVNFIYLSLLFTIYCIVLLLSLSLTHSPKLMVDRKLVGK